MPALDEEAALPAVLHDLMRAPVDDIIVIDNGSRDATAAVARAAGARVVWEPRRGYGSACRAGLAALCAPDFDDTIVFMDADGSDDAADLPELLAPLVAGSADLVIGSRTRGEREAGALLAHARAGNWLINRCLQLRTGHSFSDLGPFRAIRYDALMALQMRDRDFGWTVEMQLKAARTGLRIVEVPVRYRRRIGQSKISGTFAGSVRAGCKILWTVLRDGG